MTVLLPLSVSAQTLETKDPPQPGWEDAGIKHYVKVEAVPDVEGTSHNISGANQYYELGKMVYLTANNHNDCYFVEWRNSNNEFVSSDRSLSFNMPDCDVLYYAIYRYAPTNPETPAMPAAQYLLTLKSTPAVGGYFNWNPSRNPQKIAEGSLNSLYAYTNPGFKFVHWENSDGITVSESQNINFLMPSHPETLTAVFVYDPKDPGNPGVNTWDESSLWLTLDDFEPGDLSSTMSSVMNGSSNYSKITHFSVAGEVSKYDLGVCRNIPNCTFASLSRVAGIEKLNANLFDGNTNLQEVLIPSCITKIEYQAFRGCSMLRSFNIYAVTPPELESNVFAGVPADMIVYVPESSVSLYQAAEGWKDYTIKPLREKVCQLEVNLPAECADGRYKNMRLVLQDTKSKRMVKYVITDRLNYTFNNLVRNATYKAYLKNNGGEVLGETDVIMMDGNKSIDFKDLTSLYKVRLNVQKPGGIDVANDVTIEWKDSKNNLLMRGDVLSGQKKDAQLTYNVVLSEALGRQYKQPEPVDYTVTEGENSITLTLQPLKSVSLNGSVVVSTTAEPLAGVTVTATQMLNGKYPVAATVVTDAEGKFSLLLKAEDTKLSCSLADYVDSEAEVKVTSDGELTLGGPLKMRPINGAIVSLSHTYRESVAQGEKASVASYLSDPSSVSYTLFNETQGKAIADFKVQHPSIIIFDEVNPDDDILITCHSDKGEFEDVKVKAKVGSDLRLNASFDVVERGIIKTRIDVNDNASAVSIIYDSKGKRVTSQVYSDWNLEFKNLPDGKYKVVTMANSEFFNSVFNLSDFPEMGLIDNVDYDWYDVDLKSGEVVQVITRYVRVFDESRFYYTGSNTAYTVNKASTIMGNYLTLNAHIDFKDDVKMNVKDVKLEFHLPEGTTLVEKSVMLGNVVYPYEYADNVVTVTMGENFTDRVKMCVMPTVRGNYASTAYVTFGKEGSEVKTKQPIGSVSYTVTDISLWTPSLTASKEIVIDGNATSGANIVVYDGDNIIGSTTAKANGYWSLTANLNNPKNLSMHSIYAKVTTLDGIEMRSDVRAVEYNTGSIEAKNIEMTFYNDLVGRTVWVNFDLERSATNVKSYPFEEGVDFVFKADLTDNDPEKVHACNIRVFTNKHEWIDLPAKYIPVLNKWVAYSRFDFGTMPIAVRADIDADIATGINPEELNQSSADLTEEAEGEALAAGMSVESYLMSKLISYIDAAGEKVDLQAILDSDVRIPEDAIDLVTEQEDITRKIITEDDGSIIIVEPNGSKYAWKLSPKASEKAKRRAPIAAVQVDTLKQELALLSDNVLAFTKFIDETAIYVKDMLKTETDPEKIAKLTKLGEDVKSCNGIVRDLSWLMSFANYGIKDMNEWEAFISRIRPCNGPDDPQAWALKELAQMEKREHGRRYITAVRLANLGGALVGYYKEHAGAEISFSALQKVISSYIVGVALDIYKQNKALSHNHMRRMKRERNSYVCNYETMEDLDRDIDLSIPYPTVDPIIDPSGYVYEGVPSNRLEGVTATVYYKHVYEDDMGDTKEEEILWDAENYSQENPIYTDADGAYSWDVPQGEWRVKFEKQGYVTTYSEWLPVPPPQLDVNIAMTQNSQPEVVGARAFQATAGQKGGVDITFDKYMRPATLTSDNILIKGVKGEGEEMQEEFVSDLEIEFNNLEADLSGENEYASKVTVLTDALDGYDKLYLIVKQPVESYAGIHMTEAYEQELDIQKKVRSLSVEALFNVAFGSDTEVLIAALPSEAAAGKKVLVKTGASMIATLGGDAAEEIEVELDADGQGKISVHAESFGSAAISLEVVDADVKASTIVNVLDESFLDPVKAPTASRLSGTSVFRGQTVTLACETEGATIYYTLDGTCPCESPTRIKYNGQAIQINDNMHLSIMSVGINGDESEVKEYSYSIRKATGNLELVEGWNWASHTQSDALASEGFKQPQSIVRVKTQNAEMLYDPSAASYTGSVGDILASQAVKVQASASAQVALQGDLFNPSTNTIDLAEGWNWLGYPLDAVQTPEEALAKLDVEEGDVLVGITDGYAQYADGAWVGTLETMVPGQGYMYKSMSQKSFIYTSKATSIAQSLYGHRLDLSASEWNVNPRNYPSVMCVTADLYIEGEKASADLYRIGVFAGDECRGVAKHIGDTYFISVYGDEAAELAFLVENIETGDVVEADEKVSFAADVVGSVSAPFSLNAIDIVGIGSASADTSAKGIYSLTGVLLSEDAASAKALPQGVYIVNGRKYIKR